MKSFFNNNRFPIFFTLAMFGLTGYSLLLDMTHKNEIFWFQRSGALIVLAGANLQYAKVVDLWKRALATETPPLNVDEQIASGKGISMRSPASEASTAHAFAIRIHGIITEKNVKDIWAILLILFGTIIWGYADLPFK